MNEFRARYDAMYELVGAHITIAFPDQIELDFEEARVRLTDIASQTKPFTVILDRWVGINDLLYFNPKPTRFLIERYPNAVNALFLVASAGANEMVELRYAFDAVIPQPSLLLDYPPFMCFGQTLSDEEYVKASTALADFKPDFRFQISEFQFLREGADGVWNTEAGFSLGCL